MEEELLSLKWNNHRSTLLKVVGDLRMKASYTDATLACSGNFYPVHKLVLSSCSNYFKSVFDYVTCKSPVIILKDIESKHLEYLLDYMYIGEVNVKQNELSALVSVAEWLQIKGLAVPEESVSNSSFLKKHFTSSQNSSSPPSKRKKLTKSSETSNSRDEDSVKCENNSFNNIGLETIEEKSNIKLEPIEPVDNTYVNHEMENTGVHLSHEESQVNHRPDHIVDVRRELLPITKTDPETSCKGEEFISNLCHMKNSSDHCQPILSYISPDCKKAGQFSPSLAPDTVYIKEGSPETEASNSIEESTTLQVTPIYDCHLCSFVTEIQADLNAHLLNHRVEKKLECPCCDYKTKDRSNFRRHFRIHTGVKPFVCGFCDYRCSDNSALKKHVLTHKKNSSISNTNFPAQPRVEEVGSGCPNALESSPSKATF